MAGSFFLASSMSALNGVGFPAFGCASPEGGGDCSWSCGPLSAPWSARWGTPWGTAKTAGGGRSVRKPNPIRENLSRQVRTHARTKTLRIIALRKKWNARGRTYAPRKSKGGTRFLEWRPLQADLKAEIGIGR